MQTESQRRKNRRQMSIAVRERKERVNLFDRMTVCDRFDHFLCLTLRADRQCLLVNDHVGPVVRHVDRLRKRIDSFSKLLDQLTSLLVLHHVDDCSNIGHASTHSGKQTDQKFLDLLGFAMEKIFQHGFDQIGKWWDAVPNFLPQTLLCPQFRWMKI